MLGHRRRRRHDGAATREALRRGAQPAAREDERHRPERPQHDVARVVLLQRLAPSVHELHAAPQARPLAAGVPQLAQEGGVDIAVRGWRPLAGPCRRSAHLAGPRRARNA